MKILITGGAGFIGYHLTKHLLKTNPEAELVLVDNLQRGRMDNDFKKIIEHKNVRFLALDLTDLNSYKELGGDYNHVYHLAAVNGTDLFYKMPEKVLRTNVLSLVYMLDWFKDNSKNGKFCFTSSNEAYAGGVMKFESLFPVPTPEDVPLVIEDAYNPRWSYGSSKLVGELFVINYAKMYDFRALIVRPHNFYGPRAGFDHVIPQFSGRIADKVDPFPLFGGADTRTFCYIDDAVRAMQMLMDSTSTDNQPIETVHIGDELEITIKDLLDKMFNVAGWKPSNIEVKDQVKGSVSRRKANIDKIQSMVDWKPKVSLDEGLKKTYEWYRDNPNKL
jgi:nucleoside-diphosphate-sugar epimerase